MSAITLAHARAEAMVSGRGQAYRILTAFPDGPPPERGFPVIYLLDADAVFLTMVESLRMRCHRPDATGIVPAVIVGIGYPDGAPHDRERRRHDFTTPSNDPASGGAEAFLDFIEGELMPRIEAACPVDRGRRGIFAHSLGGFLALHIVSRRIHMFNAYVAVSPSIWWERDGLFARARALDAEAGRDRRILVCAGEYEQGLAPWQADTPQSREALERRRRRDMIGNAAAFAQEIERRRIPGLTARFDLIAQEDHASVVHAAMSRGLRFILAPRAGEAAG